MYYILFVRVIHLALANRDNSNGDGFMGLRVVNGTLEATGDWKKKGGTTTFEFWRIHDAAGHDHFIQNVRVREYMRSHALPGVQGAFVFSSGAGPVAFGMKHVDGQIVEDLEAWKPDNPIKVALLFLVGLFVGWIGWLLGGTDGVPGLLKAVGILLFLIAMVLVPFFGIAALVTPFMPKPPSSEEFRKALAQE